MCRPGHGAPRASKSIVIASARPMRARAGSGCSGPGCATPSGPFTAGGIGGAVDGGAPQADVLHEEPARRVATNPDVLA